MDNLFWLQLQTDSLSFVDMESVLPVQPKVRSPAVSAASKEETKAPTLVEESPDVDSLNGAKATNIDVSSSDNKATTIPDVAEGTMESKNVKEDKPVEVTPVAKDSQEKLPAGEQGEKPSVLFLFLASPCVCCSLSYNFIAKDVHKLFGIRCSR